MHLRRESEEKEIRCVKITRILRGKWKKKYLKTKYSKLNEENF